HHILEERAHFLDAELAFVLTSPPETGITVGRYHLISKSKPPHPSDKIAENPPEYGSFLYRLSHPLGEYVIETAKALETPNTHITFDVSHHSVRLHVIEALRGKRGFLVLNKLSVESYEKE